jgi:hypothetical protein
MVDLIGAYKIICIPAEGALRGFPKGSGMASHVDINPKGAAVEGGLYFSG